MGRETTVSNESNKENIARLMCNLALCMLLVGAMAVLPKAALAQPNGDLHITKECSAYTGLAGSYCTITSSNVAAIPVGATVNYDQAFNIPVGMLDSNVVLKVGTSDWAVGRCTLDGATGAGLCTFTDGVGQLTGFHARVNVSYLGGVNYGWDGTYGFTPPGLLK
jgi:hypothetical protein